MTIEDSKLVEILATGLLTIGGFVFGLGVWLGKKQIERLDKLSKISRFIVPRKEFEAMRQQIKQANLENLALRMSIEDKDKIYKVENNGYMGFVIVEDDTKTKK